MSNDGVVSVQGGKCILKLVDDVTFAIFQNIAKVSKMPVGDGVIGSTMVDTVWVVMSSSRQTSITQITISMHMEAMLQVLILCIKTSDPM